MSKNRKPKERILTDKEQARAERFSTIAENLKAQGYEQHDLTVDITEANVQGLLSMLPFGLIFVLLFVKYGLNDIRDLALGLTDLGIMIIGMFALIVLHELIHGLTWSFFCKNHFKSIEFGVIWSMLTPYCTCAEPLRKNQYLIGAAMPTIIVGFLLGAVAIVSSSTLLAWLALIMIFAGGGDMLIIIKVLAYKSEKQEIVYIDHPYECGLVVFER